jgi:KDO2-lipid IV(A) lauroyltransferase
MNWEYGNWIMAKNIKIPFIAIYQKIGNKAFNKLFYNLRSRYNSVMVSTTDFKNKKEEILTNPYSLALAADQNGNPDSCYWLYFFSKPAPFVTGPAKGAIKNNTAIVFAHFRIRKRGYYHFDTTVVAENANEFSPEELTLRFRDLLEQTIKESPDNYLWSHRRWRHDYSEKYSHLWIDTKKP